MRDTKFTGAMTEARFQYECMRRGVHCARPVSEESYDFLVHRPGQRKVLRVQVKGSSHLNANGYGQLNLLSRHRRYTVREIDFVAAWCEPFDSWFIVPVAALSKRRNFVITPSGGYLRRYQNRWDLLK